MAGSPPPPTTKLSIFRPGGYRIAINTYLTGIEVDAKLELLTQQIYAIAKRLEVQDLSVSQLGSPDENPADQNAATVCVRIAAAAPTRETLFELHRAFGALGLSSVPGFMGGDTTGPKPRIEYWPGLLPQDALRHRVVLANGDTIAVGGPAVTAAFTGQPTHPEPATGPESVETQRVPLGRLVYARSGDKGGNSNIGIWTPNPDAWEWLRTTLSTDDLKQLFPEFADLPVVRHEFPHLRAVHFVLPQLLGRGGSSNLRVDSIGKSVSEYVRARLVDIPVGLL